MRIPARSGQRRDGMTLLEVLLALAIFLFSLVALSQLFNSATDQAVEIQWKSRATRLAQSKLAEFTAGVLSLQTGGSGNFDDEPEWEWKSDITPADGTAQGLYMVTITVSRPGKQPIETSLSQYIFDPRMKGTIPSNPSSSGSSTGSSATTSGTGTASTQTSGGGQSTGGK